MSDRLSPALSGAKILARQACYRPVTQDGLPLIGRISGLNGAFVATGHGVWGILNAPATGEALADLVVHGVSRNVDLSPFTRHDFTLLILSLADCSAPQGFMPLGSREMDSLLRSAADTGAFVCREIGGAGLCQNSSI